MPLVATFAIWGGVIYAGAWTGAALSDRASARVAAISLSQEVAAGRH